MGCDIAINVEVRISDELKRLLAASVGQVRVPKAGEVAATPGPDALHADRDAGWRGVVLRRDGQRPLSFRGLPLVTRTCGVDSPHGRVEQALALYLAEDRTIYAALVFEPAETAPARPMYRCQPIRDPDDFAAFLAEWQPEHCFEAGTRTDPEQSRDRSAGHLAVRSAFNSMTADCLCEGVLQG